MNVEGVEDVDLYVTQLRDVFDSCDIQDQGYLSRSELLALCHKLQLDDQAEDIVNHLIDNAECNQIDFEHFKDNFVKILCQSTIDRVEQQNDYSLNNSIHEQFMDADQFEDADEEEESEEEGEVGEEHQEVLEVEKHEEEETKEENGVLTPIKNLKEEVSPKYVKGNKRYGRRSRPFESKDFEEFLNSNATSDNEEVKPPQKHQTETDLSDLDRVCKRPPLPPGKGKQQKKPKKTTVSHLSNKI